MRFVSTLTLLLAATALGQMNSGELSGSVQDRSGGVLPGAIIIAEHLTTGQKFSAVTNSAGEYLLPQLSVGVFSLTVSAADFNQSSLPRLEIHASDRLRRDFTLEVGNRADVVTVLADSVGVQLSSASRWQRL